ncbi:MAG: long-chain fatty acid--CoA ligase [Solirubrobacteraceae bacterium]
MSQHTHATTLPPPLMGDGNLAALLTSAATRWPQRCALVHEGVEISYAELERRSRLAAGYLAGVGIAPGDRVGLQVPNSPAFAALYFGILRRGAIVVPQNPLATPAETDQSLEDAGAEIVLSRATSGDNGDTGSHRVRRVWVQDDDASGLLQGAAPYPDVHPVAPDDTAVILYTSGTTGRPKGAELTHANLGRNANAALEIYSLAPDDVVIGVLPLYHSYGQTCTMNAGIAIGARVILSGRFDASPVAELIREHAVTVLLGVPTMFSDLAYCEARADAFASLRLCSSGGAPLPAEVLRAFEARTGAPLYEGYGLSETSPIASHNALGTPRRSGTIGWPIPGTEMKIAGEGGAELAAGEIGEIAIRGHNIMKGYWGNPEATKTAIDRDGWFFSGDLGTVDDDGCFRVVGRLKDMIIRGGFNVYPREVEDLMHEHPAVRSAAVIGIPDERLGEEIGAAVVLEPDTEASPAELQEWIKVRVSRYKYPRHIWLVSELPTGPTGKILKRAIVPPPGIANRRGESAS